MFVLCEKDVSEFDQAAQSYALWGFNTIWKKDHESFLAYLKFVMTEF